MGLSLRKNVENGDIYQGSVVMGKSSVINAVDTILGKSGFAWNYIDLAISGLISDVNSNWISRHLHLRVHYQR